MVGTSVFRPKPRSRETFFLLGPGIRANLFASDATTFVIFRGFMKNRSIASTVIGTSGLALAVLFAFLCIAATRVSAQGTVWNGPMITFTEPAGDNGTLPSDQDRITSDVWLTRNTTMGLFNVALENSYSHYLSPTNTEWAYGALANYTNLTYASWEAWNGMNPPSMLNQRAVLHLISDNIYIGIEFMSWGERGVGGFSYERTTTSVPEASMESLLLAGSAVFGIRRWRGRMKSKR
jgi:hypothetical protein